MIGWRMQLVLVLSLFTWASSVILGQEQTKRFDDSRSNERTRSEGQLFPAGVLSDSRTRWYSEHLAAMNERVLTEPETANGLAATKESYRFLWLPSFWHPVAVRFEDIGGRYRVNVKELDGKGGYQPGKLVRDESRELTRKRWNELTRRIQKCSFWTMATTEESRILDGEQWILEGVRGGKYHIVDRQSPKASTEHRKLREYCELGLFILREAGFPRKSARAR